MTNTNKAKLIKQATAVFYARRTGNVRREQAAYDKLRQTCDALNVDLGSVLTQVEDHLKKSPAAIMQGVV